MKYLALTILAASIWRVTHCPETGGVCRCSDQSVTVALFAAACIAGAVSIYPRKQKKKAEVVL